MLNSVVRISSFGNLLGTGTIVSVPSESIKGRRWPYLVTADHVVKDQMGVEVEVPDPRTLQVLFDPQPVDGWRQPIAGVDLAIARLPEEQDRAWQGQRIEHEMLPPELLPALGATLHYLGIFAPLDRPMARTGAMGALQVPIEKPDYAYEGHLVDCRSYAGFSGSPCFSVHSFALLDERVPRPPEVPLRADGAEPQLVPLGHYAMMVGLFTAHYTDEAAEDNPDDLVSRYGVGVMLGARYIWEALMTYEARDERREWDEQHQTAQAAAQPPLRDAGAESPNEEFERFEDLTRKLVHTPKPAKD